MHEAVHVVPTVSSTTEESLVLVHSDDVAPCATEADITTHKKDLSFEEEEKLRELSAAVAAAAPSAPSPPSSAVAPDAAVVSSLSVSRDSDSITAKIDAVDVSARIAMLDKLKADMERNFILMKKAYGGPPGRNSKKVQQQQQHIEGAETADSSGRGVCGDASMAEN